MKNKKIEEVFGREINKIGRKLYKIDDHIDYWGDEFCQKEITKRDFLRGELAAIERLKTELDKLI